MYTRSTTPNAVERMRCCLIKSVIVSIALIICPAYAKEQLQAFVVGDSLTAGVFAGSDGIKVKTVGNPFLDWVIKQLFVQPSYRWADGNNIKSVKKLLADDGIFMKFDNYAVAGATTRDVISDQIPKVYNNHTRYSAGFIFIGINNLCLGESIPEVVEDMVKIVSAASHVADKVYLVPIPRVDMLHQTVKGKRTKWLIPVETVWKLHEMCPRLTYKGEKYFTQNTTWVNEFNMVAEEMELYDPRLKVTTSVHGIIPMPEYVSNVDGFHLSKRGHELLAKHIFTYVRQDFFPPAR